MNMSSRSQEKRNTPHIAGGPCSLSGITQFSISPKGPRPALLTPTMANLASLANSLHPTAPLAPKLLAPQAEVQILHAGLGCLAVIAGLVLSVQGVQGLGKPICSFEYVQMGTIIACLQHLVYRGSALRTPESLRENMPVLACSIC